MGRSSSLLFLAVCAWATSVFVDCSDVLRQSLLGTLFETEKGQNSSSSNDQSYPLLERKIFSKRNAFEAFGANRLDSAMEDHDAFRVFGNSWNLADGVRDIPEDQLKFHDIHDHHLRYLIASTAEESDSGGRSSNLSIWLTLVIAAIAAAILS